MEYKIFIDTNVYLDYLIHRGNDWTEAEAVLLLAEENALDVFTSSSCILNLMYIMGTYKIEKANILSYTQTILSYSKLISPDNEKFSMALNAGFTDPEDAVQYYTALGIKGIDYFITSNIKDYKKAMPQLPVVTPKQFMTLYKKKSW